MRRSCIRLAAAAGVVSMAGLPATCGGHLSARDERSMLEYGYSGSGQAAREFVQLMQSLVVQRLLLDIAAAPRDRAFVAAALADTGVTGDQLQRLGLLRAEGDRYVLAFSLLTQEDRQRIQAVAEREGARLAGELLVHRDRIESLVKSGSMPTADWRATAYFVLGCASLDWDGLDWVEKNGYLAVPPEGTFLPTASVLVPRETYRGMYWGSRSYHDSIAVTTFGDHYSTPRAGLPDVLLRIAVEAPEPAGTKLREAAEGLVRRHAARLMLALRDGPKTTDQMAASTGLAQPDVKDVLELLAALEYVTESQGVYTAVIPVLTERDRAMVAELRRVGRGAIVKWFDERYPSVRADLAQLTPGRYGVPLSHSFYRIWHYLFAVANRELVAAGLFADPYDSSRKFKGFIPAVYQLNVVKGPL